MIERKSAWFKKMENLCENAKIVFGHQINEEIALAQAQRKEIENVLYRSANLMQDQIR